MSCTLVFAGLINHPYQWPLPATLVHSHRAAPLWIPSAKDRDHTTKLIAPFCTNGFYKKPAYPHLRVVREPRAPLSLHTNTSGW